MRGKTVNVFAYNWRRNWRKKNKKNERRILSLIPFAAMFFLLMLASTLQNSYEDEYIRYLTEKYPTDAFNINQDTYEHFPGREVMTVYDYYKISENEITAYYLAEREHSVLAIEGMIEYGQFPQKSSEILVSREYLEALSPRPENFKDFVGESLTFCGRDFVISGILYAREDETWEFGSKRNVHYSMYFDSDIYYRRIEGSNIFIPYEAIRTMTEPQDYLDIMPDGTSTQILRVYVPDLFFREGLVTELKAAMRQNSINIFEQDIKDAESSLENISEVFYLVFFFCFVIACLFMGSQIQIELFYRRREFGFLQIFGVKRGRILAVILSDYVMKIVFSLLLAIPFYLMGIAGYGLMFHSLVFFHPGQMAGIICLILLFYFVTVILSALHFLRKDIITLITESAA